MSIPSDLPPFERLQMQAMQQPKPIKRCESYDDILDAIDACYRKEDEKLVAQTQAQIKADIRAKMFKNVLGTK